MESHKGTVTRHKWTDVNANAPQSRVQMCDYCALRLSQRVCFGRNPERLVTVALF